MTEKMGKTMLYYTLMIQARFPFLNNKHKNGKKL